MQAIIDTSSLLKIAECYTFFDKKGDFKKTFSKLYLEGAIIIIDKVIIESKKFRRIDVLNEFPFIEENKAKILNTIGVLPTPKFSTQLDNNFCNKDIIRKRQIDQIGYDQEKTDYLEGADAKMIIYGLSIFKENPVIVTEETKFSNDGKIFAKIPFICEQLKLQCCSAPWFLKNHCDMDLEFSFA